MLQILTMPIKDCQLLHTIQVCHDIPVTGRQCDGLDLENCQEVAVSELKCRQVLLFDNETDSD